MEIRCSLRQISNDCIVMSITDSNTLVQSYILYIFKKIGMYLEFQVIFKNYYK